MAVATLCALWTEILTCHHFLYISSLSFLGENRMKGGGKEIEKKESQRGGKKEGEEEKGSS